jgi:hypothetical protein
MADFFECIDGKLSSNISANIRFIPSLFFSGRQKNYVHKYCYALKHVPLHQAYFPSFHYYSTQVNGTLHASGGLLSYRQFLVLYLIVTGGVEM